MRKNLIILVILLYLTSPCPATIITIEADDFAAGTNLSHAFDGITLSASDGSDIYSVASTNIGGELGTNVLGYGSNENWQFGPYNDYDYMGEYLIIDFDNVVGSVSARYAATDDILMSHVVIMRGFGSGGEARDISIGFDIIYGDDYASVVMFGGPFAQVVVGMTEGWAVSLDHIRIDLTVIPEPATFILLALGMVVSRKRPDYKTGTGGR